MGRRSLTSTKGGKFMNPTDQARKEARKKELKKNKKQRMAVRQAVLKGKDPHAIIEDLIKIDEMQFNVTSTTAPPLSEKVLTDKRRKLLETLERVETLYRKEDVDKHRALKAMFREYEQRRSELVRYFESVKQAEMVTPDEIPLPTAPTVVSVGALQDIPMPSSAPPPPTPKSILKKHPSSFFSDMQLQQKKDTVTEKIVGTKDDSKTSPPGTNGAPGVPIGPPPNLSDCSDIEEEDDPALVALPLPLPPPLPPISRKVPATQLQANPAPQVKTANEVTSGSGQGKQLRFAPQPTTAKDEVLEFLQQLEKVHQKEQQPNVGKQNLPGGPPGLSTPAGQQPPIGPPGQPPVLQPPPIGMPPPPPPGMWNAPFPPPPHPDFMLPPGMPPHGGPPPMGGPKGGPPPNHRGPPGQMYHVNKPISTAGKTTIQAKPQMRSLQQEVVKFVPAQLRKKGLLSNAAAIGATCDNSNRREGSGLTGIGSSGNKKESASGLTNVPATQPNADNNHKGQPSTKDDAYAQFMKEMQGLI
ncbi:WW domain-binding protein 11-like [Tropilaelaps mercedesae]|uniref:WW domain-binding protein 11-like n=1 Tax=Tropilaelaps mercedesae TaxID=418985 RepID=A0A1V9Y0G5_9ACAR|nr:WW domain-binding protein 11-like [Tropilaelaps mercedesae]